MTTYTLSYKTSIFGKIEEHKRTGLSLEKAESIKWQFSEGDFGDCIISDIQITAEGHSPPDCILFKISNSFVHKIAMKKFRMIMAMILKENYRATKQQLQWLADAYLELELSL